jgi:hypothetical protein
MRDLKKGALCAAWIAGLICLGWLLWFLTEGAMARGLERQLNRILLARGERFSVVTVQRRRNQRVPLGIEFIIEARNPEAADPPVGGTLLAFPLVSGGAALSCGALINSQGRVERIIPLGTHAEQAFDRLTGRVLDLYIRRIEGGEQL